MSRKHLAALVIALAARGQQAERMRIGVLGFLAMAESGSDGTRGSVP